MEKIIPLMSLQGGSRHMVSLYRGGVAGCAGSEPRTGRSGRPPGAAVRRVWPHVWGRTGALGAGERAFLTQVFLQLSCKSEVISN